MSTLVKVSGGHAEVINTTEIDVHDVIRALPPEYGPIMDVMGEWVQRTQGPVYGRQGHRVGSILDRDRWLPPPDTAGKIRLARKALTDDIVGNAVDGSEAFALSKVGIYCDDEDQEDIWNQWAGDINLDDRLRAGWRTLSSDSQMAFLVWWSRRSYTPRGIRESMPKRSQFDVLVPIGWTYIDTTKVVPVGSLMFGQERLAYAATPLEAARFDRVIAKREGWPVPSWRDRLSGLSRYIRRDHRYDIPSQLDDAVELDDELIRQAVMRRYNPDFEERRLLEEEGVETTNLFLLNPEMAFRHTLTRPDFQRFADVRFESLFELLDIKAQLRQLDRTVTIGGAHWILVIRKGDKDKPAEQHEIDNLQAQAIMLASVPVIVGDHRLQVDILTPKQDHTLDESKHDTIDRRLFARSWNTFLQTGNEHSDALKTARVIAKNLESRRLMLRRTIEREIFERIRKSNPKLTDRAVLRFTPANISLNFDAAYASWLLDLRAAGEISRDSTLGSFDMDEAHEYRMRKRERETGMDDEFVPTKLHAPPDPALAHDPKPLKGGGGQSAVDPGSMESRSQQRAAGRNAKGGGAAPGSGQGEAARRPGHESNTPTPTQAAKDMLTMDRDALLDLAKAFQIPGRYHMNKPQLRNAIRDARIAQITDEIEVEAEEES